MDADGKEFDVQFAALFNEVDEISFVPKEESLINVFHEDWKAFLSSDNFYEKEIPESL